MEGWRQGLVSMPEKCEGWIQCQNSAGVDLPKSALETEDHVLRAEHIYAINIVPHQGWSTHERAPLLEGTCPYCHFEGYPTDKGRASPPVARQEWAQKHPPHRPENLHHRGAVQPPEQQDLCSNVPWGEGERSEGAERPSPFLHNGLVGGVPIRWWYRFIFVRKGWNWCLSVSGGCATRSCEALTEPSVRNESSSRTQLLPTGQDNSGVAAEEPFGLHQRRELALRECRPHPPGL